MTEMKSQIYKNGVISVCVPSGWKLFTGIDSGGKETSEKVHIYKNIELNTDVFRKAGITICYYGEDKIYLQARDFYDDVKDIEPFEMGRYVWYGYTCTSMGYPYIMLEAYEGKAVFQVMLLLENNGERISLDDSDVCMIIESIKSEKRNENVT